MFYLDEESVLDMDEMTDIPFTTFTQKIRELDELTTYRIILWATTGAGRGIPFTLEERTLETGVPDVPGFSHIEHGDNHLNVSFEPTAAGKTENPGSHFIVEYRPKGECSIQE